MYVIYTAFLQQSKLEKTINVKKIIKKIKYIYYLLFIIIKVFISSFSYSVGWRGGGRGVSLAVSVVAKVEEVEEVEWEAGEVGTLGITFIEKNPCISGLMQFKPVLLQGQLYMDCCSLLHLQYLKHFLDQSIWLHRWMKPSSMTSDSLFSATELCCFPGDTQRH